MKVYCQWCGKDMESERWGSRYPVKVEVKAGQVQRLYSLCDSCAEKLVAELDDRILRHVPPDTGNPYVGPGVYVEPEPAASPFTLGVWTGTKWTAFGAAVDISGPAPDEKGGK